MIVMELTAKVHDMAAGGGTHTNASGFSVTHTRVQTLRRAHLRNTSNHMYESALRERRESLVRRPARNSNFKDAAPS